MPTTINTSVPFTIEVALTDTVTLLFDGGPGPIVKTGLSTDNDGTPITHITAVTSSGAPYTHPITITGDDANKVVLTNGGVPPCDLIIGTQDFPAGTHTGTWVFKAPTP